MSLSNNRLIAAVVIGGLIAAVASFGVIYGLRSNSTIFGTVEQVTSALGSKQNPHEVALTGDSTKPVDILINVGDYVQFNSKDGKEHQIIQGKPTVDHGHEELADAIHGEDHGTTFSPLDSGVIEADEGYLVQFNSVGKYDFHDNYNHDYAITVIVYDKDKKLEDTKVE